MKDLLKILGCKEDAPGSHMGQEKSKANRLPCEVTHEPDKKGTIRQKSKFAEEGLPF